MAVDTFAKIGDIRGESTDNRHKDEVEVLSWSWGVSQSGTTAAGGAGGAGKPSFQDFQFNHAVDRASPYFLKACATGEHIRDATFTSRKAGPSQLDYLIIRMNDVIITGVHPSSIPGGVVETVGLQFGKVDLEYKPQKADGSQDAGIHFTFDIKANREP